jgi:Tfp pilus assembly protein PilF
MSVDAQDLYLRAIAEAYGPQRSMPGAAIDLLDRAVALEPGFAEAWSLLAAERIRLANQNPGPERDALYARARTEALTAIELDPALGQAHSTLANIRFYYDWDWAAAEQYYRRAVELSPGSSDVHVNYAMFLAAMGRIDEALVMGRIAQSLEPMTPLVATSLATLYHYAGQPDAARREVQRALSLAPGFRTASFRLCVIAASQGRFDEATSSCEESIRAGNLLSGRLELARVYALAGKREAALGALQEVLATKNGPFISPDNIAFIDAALGDRDQAFSRLQQALARRAPNLLWIQVDPRFDPLRSDARFATIFDRVRAGGR